MKMTDPMPESSNCAEMLEFDGLPKSAGIASTKVRNLRISLRQWKMFHAVIDFDGFTGAANGLNVTQSTISHAVSKLQEQLGVSLLVLKGRKAEITEEGKILLGRSRDLVRNAMELEELAENLRQGWGPEIKLAIDRSFPTDLLMLALQRLSPLQWDIRLSVKEATLDQATQSLQDNTVDLAISTQLPFGFAGKELIDIEHVAVAHPENPLFALKRKITADDLRMQSQIAISASNDYVGVDPCKRPPRYPRPWNVSSVDSAIGVLRYGFAYAWLPKYRIQHWLDRNDIRILPVVNGSSYNRRLYLTLGQSVAADSAAKQFADALHSCSDRFFFRADKINKFS